MKKLAILTLLALEIAVCGCGNSKPSNTVSTSTSGNWEAQLTGGTGGASQLNFVTAFSVTNSGPLSITGFGFINDGPCFSTTLNAETQSGSATFTTDSTGAVTGTLTYNVQSSGGNNLSLTGNLTGNSNGTTSTTGTLTNGVVVGTWQLTGGQGDASCSGTGDFLMCQGTNTCTVP